MRVVCAGHVGTMIYLVEEERGDAGAVWGVGRGGVGELCEGDG